MHKHYMAIMAVLASLAGGTLAARAQTVNIVSGNVTYALPAEQAGDMIYTDGSTLTFIGRTLALADISEIYFDNTPVTNSTVTITYNGTEAHVVVAGNVAQYVTPTISGAHVTLVQDSLVDGTTCGEITYSLSGNSTDGAFTLEGSYKATLELCGLTLTNPSGAAIDIQDGKRINLSIKKDTENTLADSTTGTQKGCINCKGHLELKGKGTLNVSGNLGHAIYAKEYVTVKNCTINVLKAAKDGINCNQYFAQESGSVTMTDVADEGLQVSYKDDTDREADDTGQITFNGGSFASTTTAKGIKAPGDITINDGTINVKATGSTAEGIESKSVLTINGGTVTAMSPDDAINSASHLYIKGGTVTAVSSGNDGIDANGNLYIMGGTIMAFGTSSPECGIDANEEGGYSVIFTGGTLLAVGGGNSVPSTSESTQPYVSGSLSVSAGNEVTLTSGSTTLATFTVPDAYTGSSSGGGQGGWGGGGWSNAMQAPGGGGPGGGGNRPGGSSGSSLLITCAGLTSGSSYAISNGSSTTTTTAALKGSQGRW